MFKYSISILLLFLTFACSFEKVSQNRTEIKDSKNEIRNEGFNAIESLKSSNQANDWELNVVQFSAVGDVTSLKLSSYYGNYVAEQNIKVRCGSKVYFVTYLHMYHLNLGKWVYTWDRQDNNTVLRHDLMDLERYFFVDKNQACYDPEGGKIVEFEDQRNFHRTIRDFINDQVELLNTNLNTDDDILVDAPPNFRCTYDTGEVRYVSSLSHDDPNCEPRTTYRR